MAHPTTSQEDYTAVKQGIVENLLKRNGNKTKRRERRKELNQEVVVSDEELRSYVDDIIREDLRNSCYNTLIEAKSSPKAIVAYYNFVNAYHLVEKGKDAFGNICCLAIDLAKDLLKAERRRKKIKKNKK